MAKQRYINTKFWSDNWIIELDPLERYLFLYFLTNEHTNIAGIYELPLRTMAFETGIDKEMLIKMLPRFEGKIYYIAGWVYIRNFSRHQAVNDSVKKGIVSSMAEVPTEIKEAIKEINDSVGTACIHPATYPNVDSNVDINSNPNTPAKRREKKVKIPFDDFYLPYPHKVDKQRAETLWGGLTLEEQKLAIADVPRRSQSPPWLKESGKYIPMPSTYLKNKRWTDELQANVPSTTVPVLRLGKAKQHDSSP